MSVDPETSLHNGLTESVPGLPAAGYFDPAHHAREMATLWHQNWLYVGRSESFTKPGAFRTLTVGDQNYLLVRGRTGSLHGFHNSCRHRGSLLCEAADGQLGT